MKMTERWAACHLEHADRTLVVISLLTTSCPCLDVYLIFSHLYVTCVYVLFGLCCSAALWLVFVCLLFLQTLAVNIS